MFSRNVLLAFVVCFYDAESQVIDFSANVQDPFLSFWPFSPQFNLDFFRPRQPWWKGPNVCVERHNDDSNKDKEERNETRAAQDLEKLDDTIANHFQAALTFSSCYETPDRYECATKTNIHGAEKTHVVKYKCCHGFAKSRIQNVCVKQHELKPIMETLAKSNATAFRDLIKAYGLEDELTSNNYTVFAPKDEAIGNVTEEISAMNNIDVVRRDTSSAARETVLGHVVSGIVDIHDYSNEDLLYSQNQNSTIRLNYYPTPSGGKLVTSNCVRISRANIFSENGMVHLIDGIIPIPKRTIKELLHQDERFSSFRKALATSEMADVFNEYNQNTVFAPVNEAFNNLDEKMRQKLFAGRGCAKSILKRHISPHTVCSLAVIENATVHDLNGALINMERRSDDDVYIDGENKVLDEDILATDGVVHAINGVLIPNSAMEINDVLRDKNLTKFKEIIEKAGLVDTIESLHNVTYFVPFDAAFDEPEAVAYIEKYQNNAEKLKELVFYHSVKGEYESDEMETSLLPTFVDGRSLRMKVYPFFSNIFLKTLSPPPTIQCATLTTSEVKACGSVVHEIDKVLVPPSKSLYETLKADHRLSTFASLLDGTELEKKLKDPNASLTVLATTNYAFGRYKYDLDALKQNETLKETVLRRHIISKPVCCQELNYGDQTFNRWATYGDVFQSGNNQVIKDCDRIATNGILHTVTAFMYRHL